MNSQQIAQEILKQVTYNVPVFWSWGVSEKFSMTPQKLPDGNYQLGGLQLKVNGAKFKGTVAIRLMASDTYRVELWLPKRRSKTNPLGNPELFKSFQDVYCDELMTLIDREIETK